MVPGHFIDDHCANCDADLEPRVEALFCGDGCRQTADFVRYARSVIADGRIKQPDIREALRTRMAFLVTGGYPESDRRLASSVRAAVKARDEGRCVLCGAGGEPWLLDQHGYATTSTSGRTTGAASRRSAESAS